MRIQQGKIPELDEKTETLKVQGSNIMRLGKTLLRYIDHPSSSDKAADEHFKQKI